MSSKHEMKQFYFYTYIHILCNFLNIFFHSVNQNELIEELQQMSSLPEPLDSSPAKGDVVIESQNNSFEEQERNNNFQDINAFYLQV